MDLILNFTLITILAFGWGVLMSNLFNPPWSFLWAITGGLLIGYYVFPILVGTV